MPAANVTRMSRRLTDEDKQRFYEAYIASGRRNVEQLASDLGTTKTTLYKVIREIEMEQELAAARQAAARRSPEVDLDTRDGRAGELLDQIPDSLLETMAREALRTLLREFADQRQELERLRSENERLRSGGRS